jgi:hypothetical protein
MSNIQQVDWLTIRPATVVGLRQAYIELPAFGPVTTNWAGASDIALQYGYSASQDFTIPVITEAPAGVDFCLCIRYRIGNEVTRYKLWNTTGNVLSSAELYTGQLIKKNFVLEVWTLEDGVSVQLDEAVNFYLSIRAVPTDYRDLSAFSDATGTEVNPVVNTNDINLPAGVAPLYRLDATTGVTLEGGGDVNYWTDAVAGYIMQRSGSSSGLPTFTAADAAIIGKSSVNIVADSFLFESTSNHFTDKIMFVVFKLTSYSSAEQLFKSGANQVQYQVIANRIENKYGASAQNPIISLTLGQWYIGMFYTKALSAGLRPVRMYVEKLDDNNTVVINTSLNTNQALTTNVLTIGILANTCSYSIAEMFGYADSLSADQISQVLVYLRSKYQAGMTLPLTFPVGSPWLDNE